jgi:hypothetical protein
MNTPERSVAKAAELTRENLPSISDARLPASYELAVTAITKTSKIDECQDWSDKAMALACYAPVA